MVSTSRRDPLWLRLGCLGFVLGAFGFGAFCTGLESLAMVMMQPGHTVFAFLLATFFTLPYAVVLKLVDRNEPEPLWLLVATFLWGALVATSISIIFNTAAGSVFGAVIPVLADQLTASLAAPPVEETTKAAALLVIVIAFRHHFDNVLDGILYGAIVGLGFAWFENVSYYVGVGMEEGPLGMLKLAYVRGLLNGIASHAAYTGLTGLGFGLWRVMRRGVMRWFMPPLFLCLAIFAHFAWNSFAGIVIGLSTSTELASFVVGVPLAVGLLQVPFLILLGGVVLIALRHEDVLIHDFLDSEGEDVMPEALRGEIAPARRRMVNGAVRVFRGGPSLWWRRRQQERLLIELAFAKWHHTRGAFAWPLHEDDDVVRLRGLLRKLRR